MYALFLEYRLHWGFSVRTPLTSYASTPYHAVPPTTAMGALASVYSKISKDFNEFCYVDKKLASGALCFLEELDLREIYVTTATLSKVIPFQSPQKLTTAIYLNPQYLDKDLKELRLSNLFNFMSVGELISYHGRVAVVILHRMKEILKRLYEIGSRVTRIGNKESFVDFIDGKIVKAMFRRGNTITAWVLPKDFARSVRGSYVIEDLPFPIKREEWANHYTLEPKPPSLPLKKVIVPLYPSWVRVETEGYWELELDAPNPLKRVVALGV